MLMVPGPGNYMLFTRIDAFHQNENIFKTCAIFNNLRRTPGTGGSPGTAGTPGTGGSPGTGGTPGTGVSLGSSWNQFGVISGASGGHPEP